MPPEPGPGTLARHPSALPGASARQGNPRSTPRKPGTMPTQPRRPMLSTPPDTANCLLRSCARPERHVPEGPKDRGNAGVGPRTLDCGFRGGTEEQDHCQLFRSSGLPVSLRGSAPISCHVSPAALKVSRSCRGQKSGTSEPPLSSANARSHRVTPPAHAPTNRLAPPPSPLPFRVLPDSWQKHSLPFIVRLPRAQHSADSVALNLCNTPMR